MSNAQYDVERATAGLVMALFVASALLLAALLYFVWRDMESRSAVPASDSAQAVRVVPPRPLASTPAAEPSPAPVRLP
ncbi:MAG: hypothetical protein V5A58_13550 [Salinibacter sp.]|jgi:uncharacterized membrane protein (UPF0136 family)|uniref:hypothetical protein n=1 Tax=Salinibacter sp. TaxID=2065818 RepID=UPI002FC31888